MTNKAKRESAPVGVRRRRVYDRDGRKSVFASICNSYQPCISDPCLSFRTQRGGYLDGDVATSGGLRLHRLLFSLTRNASIKWECVRDVMKELSRQGKLKAAVEDVVGFERMTFLHMLCMYRPPVDLIHTIICASRDVSRTKNEEGMLPLHVACRFGASTEVVSILVCTNHGALHERDKEQRVPLHWLLEPDSSSASRDAINSMLTPRKCVRLENPEVVGLVATADVITLEDNAGHSPLDLLAQSSQRVAEDDWVMRDRAHEIFDLLLEHKPADSTSVFTSLRMFPEWLREHSLSNFHVRLILNEKATHPIFSMFLILDILFGLVLIVAFCLAVVQEANASPDHYLSRKTGLFILYCGVTYFSARSLMKLTGFMKIGRIDLWMTDFWQCCDLIHIGLLLACAFLVQFRHGLKEEFHWLLTVTGGLQWLNLISLLRATSMPFSVFVAFLVQMPKQLMPFIATTLLLLGSFAFMYFSSNVHSNRCTADREAFSENNGVNFCSVESSLLRVFTMFVGIVEDDFFTSGRSNLVLSVLFSFFMIILQLNVLIAVITDLYGSVRDNCEPLFWHQRFHYLYSLESVKRTLHWTDGRTEDGLSKKTRDWWDAALTLLRPHKCSSYNLENLAAGSIMHSSLRFGVAVVIPLWLIAGMMTLGWIWPPQVREYLFCPPLVAGKRNGSREREFCEQQDRTEQNLIRRNSGSEKGLEKVSQTVFEQARSLKELSAKVENIESELREILVAHDAKMYDLSCKMDQVNELLQFLVDEKKNPKPL